MIGVTEQLRDIVSNGLVIDVFKAEQAAMLFETIGDASDLINKSSFGDLFGTIQGMTVDQLYLATSRMYDKPTQYELRSLPSLINFLSSESNKLNVVDRPFLISWLNEETSIGSDILVAKGDPELTTILAECIQNNCPAFNLENPKQLTEIMCAVRDVRDKRIAHHEQIDVIKLRTATWSEFELLLDFMKSIISVVGRCYLSTGYSSDVGTYFLSADAKRVSRGLRCLLKEAKLIPNPDAQ